jgi:hypothetical protein
MFSLALSASLVACAGGSGGDDRPEATAGAETPAQQSSTSAPIFGKPILIETQIPDAAHHLGVVLRTSVIGESAFCPGGETTGSSEGATITTTFTCSSGTLTVQYSPTQRSLVQSSEWRVLSGTGDFEALRGAGSMAASFESDDPDAGREVFTGTVSEAR